MNRILFQLTQAVLFINRNLEAIDCYLYTTALRELVIISYGLITKTVL